MKVALKFFEYVVVLSQWFFIVMIMSTGEVSDDDLYPFAVVIVLLVLFPLTILSEQLAHFCFQPLEKILIQKYWDKNMDRDTNIELVHKDKITLYIQNEILFHRFGINTIKTFSLNLVFTSVLVPLSALLRNYAPNLIEYLVLILVVFVVLIAMIGVYVVAEIRYLKRIIVIEKTISK